MCALRREPDSRLPGALFRARSAGSGQIAETLVMATPLILGGSGLRRRFAGGTVQHRHRRADGDGRALRWARRRLGSGTAGRHPSAAGHAGGMVAGGIWGFIPGILKAKTGAHEVITTIMLNYLAYRISTVVIGQEDFAARQSGVAGDAARGRRRPGCRGSSRGPACMPAS